MLYLCNEFEFFKKTVLIIDKLRTQFMRKIKDILNSSHGATLFILENLKKATNYIIAMTVKGFFTYDIHISDQQVTPNRKRFLIFSKSFPSENPCPMFPSF